MGALAGILLLHCFLSQRTDFEICVSMARKCQWHLRVLENLASTQGHVVEPLKMINRLLFFEN